MANIRESTTTNQALLTTTPFLKGMNTELTGIIDSTDYTVDELNVMIRNDNTRSRRPGVDFEELCEFSNEVVDVSIQDLAFNCIEWTDINSPDESQTYAQVPYIVVQIGGKITFFRNHGLPFSQDEAEFVLDLKEYRLDATDDTTYQKERCKFATAYGCLFVTSKAIRPIRLRSAQKETSTPTVITYPYCQVSVAAFQGKHQRMGAYAGLTAFYEFFLDDIKVGHFEVPMNTAFPNSFTMAQSFNSIDAETRRNITAVPFETVANTWTNPNTGWPNLTPADWITFNAATTAERGTKISIRRYGWAYKSGRWHPRDFTDTAYMAGGSSNYTQQTELVLQVRDTDVGAQDFLNIDENPSKLSYAHLYNLLNQGWTPKLIGEFYKASDTNVKFFPGNNLAQQYLKESQLTAFKPEALVNMTFGNTPAARGHFRLNFFDQKRNTTASLTTAMQQVASTIGVEVSAILDTSFPVSPTDPAAQVPDKKPRRPYVIDIAAYAGRMFYLCGDVLLYSQVIAEDISKADHCYTDADPTSEEMSDVIASDGGTISLPEIGEGIKLQQFGEYLIVVGTRGNMLITGTANNLFTATAYSTGTLPAAPSQSPDSFVETEYGIFYWGTTGVNMITATSGGLSSTDLSSPVLMTWYGKITNEQQKFCKGVYSAAKKRVYWFYPSDTSRPRRLDLVLVFDIAHQAFTPYKIATTELDEETGEQVPVNCPEIVSGLSIKVPFKAIKEYPVEATAKDSNNIDVILEVVDDNDYKILADESIDSEEFTYESSTLVCLDVSSGKITFGDFRNNVIRDWTVGDWNGPGWNFDSYLISHAMNSGGYNRYGQRTTDIVHNKNMPYLITYFRRTETGPLTDGGYVYPSACQGAVLWDWKTAGTRGGWDAPQELYRPNKRNIFYDGYVITKTNVRGLGRAFQVKLNSVEDKQFILEALVFDLKNDGRI